SIADLFCDLWFGSEPLEIVWGPLQSSGFTMGDCTVCGGVQVPTLFRLVELGSDRDRGAILVEATPDVQLSGRTLAPATGKQLLRNIETFAALGSRGETFQRLLRDGPPQMQLTGQDRFRYPGV